MYEDEPPEQECSIDWMTAGVWWLMLFALAGLWACVFWLLGLI